MSQIIKIRRGTRRELDSRGSLLEAEMGFCTDTKEVFIGDGTENIFVGRAMCGDYASRPNASSKGRFYYVTTGENSGYLYIDDGSSWHIVNAQKLTDLEGTLDNIKEGSTYAKVKKSELTNGQVNRLSNGVTTVTVTSVNDHINESTKHRKINDSGNSTTDLWSAQKIKNELELAKHNIEYQSSVRDKNLTAPPTSLLKGDRYIIPSGGTGAWSGKTNQIAEWNDSVWNYYTPATGWTCYVDDEQRQYSFNGNSWVRTGGALQNIVAGNGLSGGGQGDSVTLNIGKGNGITVNNDSISVKPYKGITVNSNGVSVNIDNSSLQYDSANGNRLRVANIDGGSF